MKKLFSALLAVIFVFSALPFSACAVSSFPDVTDPSVAEAAASLQMLGVVDGKSGGVFDPGGLLTRAEFCKMAVVAMGKGDSVSQYANKTVFPDVLGGSHWAAGYVNLAVSKTSSDDTTPRIIAGYPDGRFHPDDKIPLGQAVTILMRVLGYSDSDVGPVWPNGYLTAATGIGLTGGVSAGAFDSITRAQAARLFVNLLGTVTKSGSGTYLTAISSSVVDNVILVSNTATASDGTKGSLQVVGGETGIYKVKRAVPDGLLGLRGSLALDAKGRAIAFLPSASGTQKSFAVGSAAGTYITCSDGTTLTVPNDVTSYLDGAKKDYSSLWVDLAAGTLGTAYYSAAGDLEYLVFSTTASDTSGAAVLRSANPSGTSLSSLFGLSSGSYKIYKNNLETSSSELRQYDVATYNKDMGAFQVSDFRLTGLYENAYPNTATPTKITVLGCELTVLPGAISDLSQFKIGESVTLLLTPSYKVAGAVSPSTLRAAPIGLAKSVSSSAAEVILTNGLKLSGKLNISDYTANQLSGQLVQVSSYSVGYLSLYQVSGSSSSAALDLSARTLGSAALAGNIRLYEKVGTSAASPIELKDLAQAKVDASRILYAGYDYAGRVNLLLLDDVTGDRYTYGLYKFTPAEPGDGMDAGANATVAVQTVGGVSTSLICGQAFENGTPGGIIGNAEGKLAARADLTGVKGIQRSAFVTDAAGNVTVVAGGYTFRVMANAPCYLKATDSWGNLTRAREFSDNLTVYYDKTPDKGGKIRLVVAN